MKHLSIIFELSIENFEQFNTFFFNKMKYRSKYTSICRLCLDRSEIELIIQNLYNQQNIFRVYIEIYEIIEAY